MRISRFSSSLPLLLVPFVLVTGGCSGGKKKGDVTGTVNLDGKPLGIGRLRFILPSGKAAEEKSAEIKDGEFSVKGVPVGENIKVTIDTKTVEMRAKPEAIERRIAEIKSSKATMVAQSKNAPADQKPDFTRFDEQLKEAEAELKESKDLAKKFRPVPAKYADEKSTDISVTIKPGDNTLDPIELKSR